MCMGEDGVKMELKSDWQTKDKSSEWWEIQSVVSQKQKQQEGGHEWGSINIAVKDWTLKQQH